MLALLHAMAGAILLLATHSYAHMQLHHPAPFNATNNPHRTTPADLYLQYPYDCCGPNDRWIFPCRGYTTGSTSLLGTPQGAPTATWPAGSTQNWSIAGIGNHYGGSCQVGFSIDGERDFRVATSYEGNCPHRLNGDGPGGQSFAFTVPADLEVGVRVFAWVWFNREQEFNMNCAAVNITAPTPTAYTTGSDLTASATTSSASVAFKDRPLMLIADDGNACLAPKTTAEVKYPFPGSEVVVGDGVYPLELPSGNCSGQTMVEVQGYHGETGEDGHDGE